MMNDDDEAIRMKYQELKDMIEKIGHPSAILRGQLSEYEKVAAEYGEEAAMLFVDKPKPVEPYYTIDYISKMHNDKYHEICVGLGGLGIQSAESVIFDKYSVKKSENAVIKIGGV